MKVCAISDMHGNLDFNVNEADLLLICGDISPLYIQGRKSEMQEWYVNTFLPWCERQPVDKVLWIAGNHDFAPYKSPAWYRRTGEMTNYKVEYIEDELYQYKKDDVVYNIFGSPWCHKFGNWAYMSKEGDSLVSTFMNMGDNCDILMVHDAPYGTSDICLQYNNENHIGNKELAYAISKCQPKICIHGHLHSANHDVEMINETKVYNVSLLDEGYKLTYEPLYLEL